MEVYLDNRIDGKPITSEQVALRRECLEDYINAPCWTASLDPDDEDE